MVRFQEAPSVDHEVVQWSPWRAELRALWKVPVSVILSVQGPASSWGQATFGPQGTPCAAPSRLCKWHGDIPWSMLVKPAAVLGRKSVVFSDLGMGSPWGESLCPGESPEQKQHLSCDLPGGPK